MAQHLMRRPPKYVQHFLDRHGKARFYFRRAGFKRRLIEKVEAPRPARTTGLPKKIGLAARSNE
jgi:hypothetical protein